MATKEDELGGQQPDGEVRYVVGSGKTDPPVKRSTARQTMRETAPKRRTRSGKQVDWIHGQPYKGKETVSIEVITPEMAKDWLSGNIDNRHIRESRVVLLAGMIRRGEWELTGDAVVFDDTGTLINGQHRLTAIVVADTPAVLVILRSVPNKAQEVMDTGVTRNLADYLHRRGYRYQNVLASGLNWTYRLAYNEEHNTAHYADPGSRPSVRQLLHLLEQETEIQDHVKPVNQMVYSLKIRPGPTVALSHRLHKVDPTDAEEFFRGLLEGTNLKRNDAVFRLREWVIQDARYSTTKGRSPDYRYVAMALKAWNFFREGRPIEHLSWQYSTTKKEDWPIPV